jgi:hypothetical protein
MYLTGYAQAGMLVTVLRDRKGYQSVGQERFMDLLTLFAVIGALALIACVALFNSQSGAIGSTGEDHRS